MMIFESAKLLKYLPEIKDAINSLKENGFLKVSKKIEKEQISVSGVSPDGTKYTELWNMPKDIHFVISERIDESGSIKDELVRQNLDGRSLRIYSKSIQTRGPIETILMYMDSPLMIYKRILDKTTGIKEHFKRKGYGDWERLWEHDSNPQKLQKSTEINGARIKHNVVEQDNTISTYLLNIKTQNVYKRTTDACGKHHYYKITPQGIINLFPKI